MFNSKFLSLIFIAWSSLVFAQVPMTGAGKGTPTVAASFQGPGDIVSGATAWGSCARVYNASLASTSTSLCDLKDSTTGTVSVCTLRGSSTGFVDLTGNYCVGSLTPTAACLAAAGGACKISKVYDQIGSTGGWVQATAASMLGLTFSAINGLPGLAGNSTNSTVLLSASISVTAPWSMAVVAERTGTVTSRSAVIGISGTIEEIGFTTSANTAIFSGNSGGTAAITATAVDNAFHSLIGTNNNASSALMIDGTDTTGSMTSSNIAAITRIGRDGSGSHSIDGLIMEVGIWPSAFSAGNRTSLNSNMHGTSGYNF